MINYCIRISIMEIPMNQLVSVGASCKKGVPQREHQRCCGPAVRLPEGSEKKPRCLSQNGRYPRDTPREKAISMGKLKINPFFFLGCNILRQQLLWLKYGFWMGKIPCQTCFRGKDPWVPCRVSLKPIYWPPLHTPKKSSAVQYSSVFINIHQYSMVVIW